MTGGEVIRFLYAGTDPFRGVRHPKLHMGAATSVPVEEVNGYGCIVRTSPSGLNAVRG